MLIVGLGNPGSEYENTRHNVGFMILDALAEKLGFDWRPDEYLKAHVAKDTEYMLLKPQTLVNDSGQTLQSLDHRGEFASDDVVVVHDDTEFPFGEVRVKMGGSSGGHNGIKSIDDAIGNGYWRVRVGVGRPENKQFDLADYVLASFTPHEQKLLPNIIDQVSDYLVQSVKDKQLTAHTFTAKPKVEK